MSYHEIPLNVLMMFDIVLYKDNIVFGTGLTRTHNESLSMKSHLFHTRIPPPPPQEKCLAVLVHHTDPDASHFMINLVYLQLKQTAFLCGITVGAAVIKSVGNW